MSEPRHNPGEPAGEPTGDPVEGETAAGLSAFLMGTVLGVRRVIGSIAELAAIEAQRAFSAAGWIMALCIGVAVTLLAAWSLLVGAFAFWLVAQGLSWAQSLLLLAATNVLAAAVMVVAIRCLASRLGFPALRRTLFRDNMNQRDEYGSHTPAGTPHPE